MACFVTAATRLAYVGVFWPWSCFGGAETPVFKALKPPELHPSCWISFWIMPYCLVWIWLENGLYWLATAFPKSTLLPAEIASLNELISSKLICLLFSASGLINCLVWFKASSKPPTTPRGLVDYRLFYFAWLEEPKYCYRESLFASKMPPKALWEY